MSEKEINEDLCNVTTCNNRYEYTLTRIPNQANGVKTFSDFCKDCLMGYLGGNNINFNITYKLVRRVVLKVFGELLLDVTEGFTRYLVKLDITEGIIVACINLPMEKSERFQEWCAYKGSVDNYRTDWRDVAKHGHKVSRDYAEKIFLEVKEIKNLQWRF